MSCYSCSSEFGFLKKEVGCEACGFSFCSKCCRKREGAFKPKELLCNKCFESLNGNKVERNQGSPPLAYKKRIAAMKNRSVSVDSASQFSNEKDKALAKRLHQLKKDGLKDAVPSEDDIAERLAKLKDMDPAKFKAPPIEVYRPPSMRTVVQEATDLMKQFALEVEMDSRLVKPEDEIAARLAKLRDQAPTVKKETDKVQPEIGLSIERTSDTPFEGMDLDEAHLSFQKQSEALLDGASRELNELIKNEEYKKAIESIPKNKDKEQSDEDDEENEANKLIEKLLAVDSDVEELDSLKSEIDETTSKSDKETTEEFPWCVICTEDAKIRCFGCDSDIYCMRCFKECHDSLDIKDHRNCPYFPPKNYGL